MTTLPMTYPILKEELKESFYEAYLSEKHYELLFSPSKLINNIYTYLGIEKEYILKINKHIRYYQQLLVRYLRHMMKYHYIQLCDQNRLRYVTKEYKKMDKYIKELEYIHRKEYELKAVFKLNNWECYTLYGFGYIFE